MVYPAELTEQKIDDVISYVCLCGDHNFQQTGHQPGTYASHARGQLDRENGIFLSRIASEI